MFESIYSVTQKVLKVFGVKLTAGQPLHKSGCVMGFSVCTALHICFLKGGLRYCYVIQEALCWKHTGALKVL